MLRFQCISLSLKKCVLSTRNSTSLYHHGGSRLRNKFCKAMTKQTNSLDVKIGHPQEGVLYELIDEESTDLKRHAESCLNPKLVETLISHPNAKGVPVVGQRGKNVMRGEHAARLPLSSLQESKAYVKNESILLGMDEEDAPIFAVKMEDESGVAAWVENGGESGGGDLRLIDLRTEGPHLDPHEAGVLGLAHSMIVWSAGQRFCGRCGAPTVPKRAGRMRLCSDVECGERFRPRLDPAIIVLVTYGEYCLLGHQRRWSPGRYSLLAGFVEVCETMESAVVREVEEETGVLVDKSSVEFISSQPHPFPSSLMLGFQARVAHQSVPPPYLPPITPDGVEITDARWFHRSWIRNFMFGGARHTVPSSVGGLDPESGKVYFNVPKGGIATDVLRTWAEASDPISTPEVKIDPKGSFKYMLLKVTDNKGLSKFIVRGDNRAAYHQHILDHADRELSCFQVSPAGGGFMAIVESPSPVIYVYGESSRFGVPEIPLVVEIMQRSNPFYKIVPTVPPEGIEYLAWNGMVGDD